MAWSYHIDKERRLVITTAWDMLTGPEVLEHQRQLSSDPDFNRDFFQLVDLTRVTGARPETILVREVCAPPIFSRRSRRGFVAPSPLTFGLNERAL